VAIDSAAVPVPGTITVVAGLPGVGKSTLSKRLAGYFSPGAHVEADRLQELIVTGRAYGAPTGLSTEAIDQLRLRLRQAALLATSFADAGVHAVVDDIVAGARYDEFVSDLNGHPFSFVMLLRDLDVMKEEWRAIGSPFADSWDWIDRDIRERTPRVGLWIDTTGKDADQVFDEVVARLDEAVVSR